MSELTNPIAKVIKNFLSSSSTEYVVRSQILELACKNLHVPEVLQALVDSVDIIKDLDTRREVLRFLFSLQPVRFPNLSEFLSKLIELLKVEKERTFRIEVIERLIAAASYEPNVRHLLLDLVTYPGLGDEEAEALTYGLSKLTAFPAEVLESLITQHQHTSFTVQVRVLRLLKSTPTLSDIMTKGLIDWLRPEVDPGVRKSVLTLLSSSRKLDSSLNPILTLLLITDSTTEQRLLSLNLLKKTQPWDVVTYNRIISAAINDSSEQVRLLANELLKDQAELSEEDKYKLIELFFTEAHPKVRGVLWERIKQFLRDENFRNYLIELFSKTSLQEFEESEFNEIVHTLLPYFRRNTQVKSLLMGVASSSAQVERRRLLAEKVLPMLDLDFDLAWIINRFEKEPSETVKSKFFLKLQPLSVIRFPALVDVYVAELLDPSSNFRVKSAQVLSGAVEIYPEKIIPPFEEILLFDIESDLLRHCLKGYLLPTISRKFDVIIAIINNDSLELSLRKQALKKAQEDVNLTDEQQKQLEYFFSNNPQFTL